MARHSLPYPSCEVLRGCPHQLCVSVGRGRQSRLKGCPAPARAWRPHNPNCVEGARAPSGQAGSSRQKAARRARRRVVRHRYLFVQRHLNKTERKTLWRVSRGLPQLQALRAIMEQVYALFDRRCRTQTALDKLATLRRRVQRFKVLGDTLKKRFSPTLEKALTFLDDKLLPSTSNAVERGNRRYRKRQKSVYRVRTQAQIRARLALDRWREAQAEGRQHTLASLHRARAG